MRLFSILLISCCIFFSSCEKNLSTKSYQYEECLSDLQEAVTCAFFIDEKIGLAAANGNVFKTEDGGMTWNSKQVTDLPIHSITFVDDNTGFLVGGIPYCFGTPCEVPGSIVFKTINAGESWNEINIPYAWSELNDVTFLDEKIGFATGLGLHMKTEDGGESWEQFSLPYKGVMNKVHFINEQSGFIAGLYGNIFKTTNQGSSWVKCENESDGHIYDLFFIDQEIAYAAGQKEMIKSVDGGKTWTILPNSPCGIFFIHFSNKNSGIALGKGIPVPKGEFHQTIPNAIYRTTNGGKSWEIEDDIPFGTVASFYSAERGYSVVPNKTFKLNFE